MATQDALSVGGVVAETYRITHLLGRGGMGAVWAAEHLRLPGRQVAVKVLLAPGVASGEAFARFRREAEIASRLGHPHIVQVLDFHTLPTGEPYIVLELLQGETLAQRLQRGPMEVTEALAIARQVGSALQAAHRAGVVHRDLKPDNVFLCAQQDELPGPNVKVLDFGISKIRGSQTVATQDAVLIGTPQYMAPEQALGRNTAIDARTDVFALGAIVYEMLGGSPAFGGSSLAEVVYKVVHAQPQPLAQLRAGLPLNVLSAVDRALQKDAGLRPPDVNAFIAELTGRPLTVPATVPQQAGMDATLASPVAQPIPLGQAVTDATFTPATPVPVPRRTEALAPRGAPAQPWATPAPERAPSAWPAPFGSPSVPKAALVGVPESPPLALRQPGRPPRRVGRGLLVALVVVAGLGVFRRLIIAHRVAAPARVAQGSPANAQGDTASSAADNSEEVKQQLQQGLEEVKKGIREAINAQSDGLKTAKAAVEKAQALRAASEAKPPSAAEALPPGTPAEVSDLLADAEDALSDEDPKLALRLAEQSFFTKKTSAGWAVKARAHCQLKDLGNARAALANVTGKAARAQVVADCREHGVDLR
ncbi:MAG: protein kinase domain-containing protein [Myxococcaceae bacterium]